jgi:hypothetical protein
MVPSRLDPDLTNSRQLEYEVKEILNKRTDRKRTEYLVWWEGYGLEDDTWEPKTRLKNVQKAVQDYKA